MLSALLCASAINALAQEAGWSWNFPSVKSYEIENKVYELANQSDQIKSSSSSQALSLLRQAASFDPTSYSPYVHVKMADCYRAAHQYPQSIKECEKALKFNPEYCEAYYSLSLTNYEFEHYDSAAQSMRKLLKISPDSRWVQTGNKFLVQIETYGNVKAAMKEIESGHMEKARQLLSAAAKHDPSEVSGSVHANLAYIFRETGKPEQALEEGKKALKYKPDDKEVMYGLAIGYQDIGKFAEAISWLQRYQGLETDSARRKLSAQLISDLEADKDKLNDADNNLPDYLDHMVGANPLHRWPEKALPIRVHVSDGQGVKGFRSHFVSYIPRAMDTWCNVSGNKLSYVMVDDAKNADIDVVWISEPVQLTETGHKRTKQGVAHIDFIDDNTIDRVCVRVDTMNGFDTAKPLDDGACASVCMHELGHALGLDHCANYSDIMYFGASSKQTGLPTKRDRATIARLYEAYPISRLAPTVKTPAPLKFLPPPAFVPPAPPGAENLAPPVFLPPPIVPESEKLTPPFFKPAPIQKSPEGSSAADTKKSLPPPPLFTPLPLSTPPTAPRKPDSKPEKGAAGGQLPFFTPPPAK